MEIRTSHPPFLKNQNLDVNTITIETSRCTLRVFHTEGVNFEVLAKSFCEANKDLFISTLLPNAEEEKDFIEKEITRRQTGDALEFFIYEKGTDTIIGSCGINALTSTEPNIGLWITPGLQGQGYGSEMYTALLDWARENTHFTFFRHGFRQENTGSIKLAEKFGGKPQSGTEKEGMLKFYIFL